MKKRCFAKRILLFLGIIIGLTFCSCGSAMPAEPEKPTENKPDEGLFRVSFVAMDQQIEEVKLPAGAEPEPPEAPEQPGLRFLRWQDAEGNEPAAIDGAKTYEAVYAPILESHVPYLFADENGLIRPDAKLTRTELSEAVYALSDGFVHENYNSSSDSDVPLGLQELRGILGMYFIRSELDSVFASFNDNGDVSRSLFALIMNRLTGRDSESAGVIPGDGAMLIPDLSDSRSDYELICEAAVPHSHGSSGKSWQDTELESRYEAGFVLLDGYLYCADEKGLFISDTVIGSLTFGYDGRCTSGDMTLDDYVSAVLRDLSHVNPEADREELLRLAYEYTRDSFSFLRRNTYALGASGWERADALTMFETRSGNCYSYAAVFWALARGLGYEATAYAGTVGITKEPHGWVEIELDGSVYICDPELELRKNESGQNISLFMLDRDMANFFYDTDGDLDTKE